MSSEKIKVLLVEDQIMMRLATSTALENSGKFELVAQAEDGVIGVEMAKKFEPDVILMDIGLPKMDGIEATSKIKELNLKSKILMFTQRDASEDVFAALKAGANGYIMKDTNPDVLSNAIINIHQGAAWLDPAIAKMVLSSVNETSIKRDAPKDKNKYGLTKRELEVLALIVEGLEDSEISEKLFVSLSTTKTHVHNILQKLYLSGRTQAAVYAVRESLV
ncbi:MAG: response regulator transcription factor [Cyanobacteria bacterium SIG30]|nr:response regulator transcription factor [Cyanobacteria bacterium SIG30]